MKYLAPFRAGFERLLDLIVILLMGSMVTVVVLAVIYRKAGNSLVWYDEIASIMLAWLTYYGASLAALKRAHIGYWGVIEALPRSLRLFFVIVAEVFVFGFFILLAWVGYEVIVVLEGDNLVSLPEISTQYTQSVIPVGAVLFIVAEFLSLPEVLSRVRGRPSTRGQELSGEATTP